MIMMIHGSHINSITASGDGASHFTDANLNLGSASFINFLHSASDRSLLLNMAIMAMSWHLWSISITSSQSHSEKDYHAYLAPLSWYNDVSSEKEIQ
jgi:hypothetical protein